jgi:hypothetical protein
MNTMPGSTQSGSFVPSFLVEPSVEAFAVPQTELKIDQPQNGPSFGKRASLAFAYYVIVFSVGVAATLAWQSYGDAVRQMIASAASTPDQQQPNNISLDLDAVRRSIDGLAVSIGTGIATSQEQTTRSIDQLTAGLEQMRHEISKLQAVEQYVLHKNSEPPPRPTPATTPVPRPSQAPIVR